MAQPEITANIAELIFHAGLLEAVEQSVIATDLNGTVIYWNRFAETVYGWSRAEALGRAISELLIPEASAPQGREIMTSLRQGRSWSGEFVVRRRDGTTFLSLVTDSPLRDSSGLLVGVIGLSIDISARRRAEDAQARLAAIVECSTDAIVGLSVRGTITDWNPGAEALLGYTAAEIVGQSAMALMPPEWSAQGRDVLRRVAGGECFEPFDTVRMHQNGRRVDMSVSITPIRGPNGEIIGAASVGRDITERKKVHAALVHQALHDGLTGLPNRNLLFARLREVLAAEPVDAPEVALLLLDLDRFKEVNDTLGHHVGDALLQEVARRLRGAVCTSDLVARLGGDEFAIVLLGANAGTATRAGQTLVRVLQAPFMLEGQPLAINGSIGIATARGPGHDADTLVRCADVAMYEAKRGGTRVSLYCAATDQHRPDRLALLGELQRAIAHDEAAAALC